MKPMRDPEPMIHFGQRLRALRKQCKLTQQNVADRLQVHRATYTKYESGSVTPDQQGLVKLAEIYGVTVDFLLGCADEPMSALANNENQQMMLSLQEKVLVELFRRLDQAEKNALVSRVQKQFRLTEE